jgi:hypothetical protein
MSVTEYPMNSSISTTVTATDVVILAQSPATVAGQVASIQFYATGTGSVTFYVRIDSINDLKSWAS